MKLQRNFLQSKMNKDLDERLIPQGEYVHAENIRVSTSEGSNIGAIENVLGNQQLTNFSLGSDAITIGYCKDVLNNKIYWMTTSSQGNYILEYDILNNVQEIVISDTRDGLDNVLGFNRNFLITDARILVNSDNNTSFLIFTDNLNEIRQINIQRAKTYLENGFEEEDISLIKKPPLNAPEITLTTVDIGQENNIRENFKRFSYRYKYLDGEYSALSPLSVKPAFFPTNFNYDYSTSINEGMVNKYSGLDLEIETGSKLVTDVEVVFKEPTSNTLFSIGVFNKEDKGWGNNEKQTIPFSNNKTPKAIAEDELFRLFDAVPRRAKALEIIGNRVIVGNYLENYNLVDSDGDKVIPKISLEAISDSVPLGVAHDTNKSDRDYEIGIVYGDDYGRSTTVLSSEEGTCNIPVINSGNKNSFRAVINNKPPSFAKWFRFFIKQNKGNYDTVVPTTFYKDGGFYWLKLNNADSNKVSEGDFLLIKSDSRGIINNRVEVKVLEKTIQERNFLNPEETESLLQQAGTYIKIKQKGFSLESDIETYEWSGYDEEGTSVLDNNISFVYPLYFYGTGLNNVSSSGTYTGNEDKRYTIQLDSNSTFGWSSSSGGSGSNIAFTAGNPVLIEEGVSITFGSSSGYNLNDYWTLTVKANDSFFNDDKKAYGLYKSLPTREIKGGSNITIVYDEYRQVNQFFEYTFVASKDYPTLEEWFWEDDILSQIPELDEGRVRFRNGVLNGTGAMRASDNIDGDDVMIIRSLGIANNFTQKVKVRTEFEISPNFNLVMETKAQDLNSDIFYEVGDTYSIEGGLHLGNSGDVSQTNSSPAVINLRSYNAFGWGNGFESIKIKDEFNNTLFSNNTRPLTTIEDYRENRRISSLTYSGVYEQSTNYNGLNEFNLSLSNFKDLDDAYGSIQKLFSRDTNLIVFQENKTYNILYNKNVIFNADGTGNVSQNKNILGQEIPYSGEYGISKNPESFAYYGNSIWHADSNRGVILRLGVDGYTEISSYGMKDYFRDYFKSNPDKVRYGGYDPYHDEYIFQLTDTDIINPNYPPIAGSLSLTIGNRAEYLFSVEDFTSNTSPAYFDLEGDQAKDLKIVALPSNGVLEYDSVAVVENQVIPLADIQSGTELKYIADDVNSAYQESFSFKISDEGSNSFSGQGSIYINVEKGIWNVQEITVEQDINPDGSESPVGVFMKSGGDRFFTLNAGTNRVHQYTLSTPLDLSTTSEDGISDVITVDYIYTNPIGLDFSNSGDTLFTIEKAPIGISGNKLRAHTLSTPWQVTFGSLNTTPSSTFDIPYRNSGQDIPKGFRFDDTGLFLLYTFESKDNEVFETFIRVYKLNSSFNISSPTLVLESKLEDISNIGNPFSFDSTGSPIDWENIDTEDTYLIAYSSSAFTHLDYLEKNISYPLYNVGNVVTSSLVNSEWIILMNSNGVVYLLKTNLGGNLGGDFIPPSTPSSITGSNYKTFGYTLTSDISIDADNPPVEYRFYRNNTAYGGWQSSNVLVVTGEATGSTATWKVKTRDSNTVPNESNFSPSFAFSTNTEAPNLIFDSATSNSITISVGSVNGALEYRTEYKESSSGTWINSGNTSSGLITLSGLSPNTSYDFRSLSYNFNGVASAYSSTLTESTLEGTAGNKTKVVDMSFNPFFGNQLDTCSQSITTTRYHDGVANLPTVGDSFFVDQQKTIPFNGQGGWFKVQFNLDTVSVQIDTFGVVTQVFACTIT